MRIIALVCFCFLLLSPAVAEDGNSPPPDIQLKFEKVPELEGFISDYRNRIQKDFLKQYNEAKAEGAIYNQWSLEVNGSLSYRGKFWSLVVRGYDYQGGAHGTPYLDVVYFDGRTKKVVPQKELLKPDAYQKLTRMCRKKLLQQGFEANDDWMLEGTKPTAENYSAIIPSDSEVEVIFPSYQIAPYAAGQPSVKLSWSEFKPLLRERYR